MMKRVFYYTIFVILIFGIASCKSKKSIKSIEREQVIASEESGLIVTGEEEIKEGESELAEVSGEIKEEKKEGEQVKDEEGQEPERCEEDEKPGEGFRCFEGGWRCGLEAGCKVGELVCAKNTKYKNGKCLCGGEQRPKEEGYICVLNKYISKCILDEQNEVSCEEDEKRMLNENEKLGFAIKNYEDWTWGCGLKRLSNEDNVCACMDYKVGIGADCNENRWVCAKSEGCVCGEYWLAQGVSRGEDCARFDSKESTICDGKKCPPRTACYKGECKFASSDQILSDPLSYESIYGHPQCAKEDGCQCAANRCKKGEYCEDDLCVKWPQYQMIDGKAITFRHIGILYREALMDTTISAEYVGYYYEQNEESEESFLADKLLASSAFNEAGKEAPFKACKDIGSFKTPAKDLDKYEFLCGHAEESFENDCSPSYYNEYELNIGWTCMDKACACGENQCKLWEVCDKGACINWSESVAKALNRII